jgi:prophage regulatory protein
MSILRLPAVLAVTGHRSHNSIYSAIRAGLFTRQVQIGQRSVGWPALEVEAINAARIAGKNDDEIRSLVNKLHAQRLDVASSMRVNMSNSLSFSANNDRHGQGLQP